MSEERTGLERWVFRTSDCLVEATRPRRENAIHSLLLRRWRSNLHGRPDRTLRAAVALAILSALLLPSGLFSFVIWHAFLAAFVLWPALRFPFDLRRGRGGVADLLMTPIPARRYVQALRATFWLSAAYAAIPYAVYWFALFGLRPILMPGLFLNWPNGAVVASAALYLGVLLGLLWLTLWCAVAGGWWLVIPLVTIPVAMMAYGRSPGRIFGTEPFPVSPGIWLAVFNLFLFGHLISLMLGRRMLVRMRELT